MASLKAVHYLTRGGPRGILSCSSAGGWKNTAQRGATTTNHDTESLLLPYNSTHQQHQPMQQTTVRHYTPMTSQEEEAEKERVKSLTPFQKDQELRKYNREIAKLEMLRGINTGELYTWRGRYKHLARDYGVPLVAWYWVIWTSTFALCYGAIHFGGVDTMAMLANIDARMGWHLVEQVDPEMGKIGMSLVLNELVEPLRLPVVILTVKPVMDQYFPPKF